METIGKLQQLLIADGHQSLWEHIMRDAKWGNVLARRIPAAFVDALTLKPDYEVAIPRAGARTFAVADGRDSAPSTISKKPKHLRQQRRRHFFRDVVATRQGVTAHIACHATPIIQGLEAAMNDTEFAPQHI